jgi:hypothetical protein
VIKPPSLQHPYTLIYSGDPSLKLPTDPTERARVLKVAQETGRWDDLILEGETPTRFDVRPLTGSDVAWWHGESERKRLSQVETAELILRLALEDVHGLGEHKARHRDVDGHRLTTMDIIDAIYAAADGSGAAIVVELAVAIAAKAHGSPSPK